MDLRFNVISPRRVGADVVVFFVRKHTSSFRRDLRMSLSIGGDWLRRLIDAGDFLGKESEVAIVNTPQGSKIRRVMLVGTGDAQTPTLETLRRSAASAAKAAGKLKAKSISFVAPEVRSGREDVILSIFEGAALGLYRFDKYKKPPESGNSEVEAIHVVSSSRSDAGPGRRAAERATAIVGGTVLARDLSNAPGNELYPETLAAAALACGERNGISVTVLDENDIQEAGMGGVVAVSRGSGRPPRFIIMEYGPTKGRPVVLIGKGVTFDSGGISIKPSAGMAEMKMDMSGAAAVIGTFESVSRLKLPVRLVGLIPAVENMTGAEAQRPGDIIRHLNGKTSEVDNTDAEGRLVLADALAYAERYAPSAVIDLATLTGAVVVALGHFATGMMGNNRRLMHQLSEAGQHTYERVWELPLFDEYERLIRSDVADVKNVGGRWAGAITAGWFLKKHVGSYPWVHLDIAGTAILEENADYAVKGGSGVGVRLLTEFLRRRKTR